MRGMDGPQTGRDNYLAADETWNRPYLLLDVRDCDFFVQESIATAKSYPASRFSRVNWEAPFLRQYVSINQKLKEIDVKLLADLNLYYAER